MSTTDDNIARAKACGANHFYMTGGSSKFSIALDQLNAYTAQSIADAQRVPMSEKPNMCRIAQFKLDTLKAEGFVVNGYAIQRASHAGGWQRGFITEGGMVGWWADPETTQSHHNIQEVKP